MCEEVVVPSAATGLIIGRNGTMMKQIKDESGASVLVPRSKEDEEPTVAVKVNTQPSFSPQAFNSL